MLASLRTKSQITIPKEIVLDLGLNEGDVFDVYEKDGGIYLMPVVVYPKAYIEELHNEINTIKSDIQSGKQPLYDNIDALFNSLEN